MTVKELIEELQKQNPGANVRVQTDYGYYPLVIGAFADGRTGNIMLDTEE